MTGELTTSLDELAHEVANRYPVIAGGLLPNWVDDDDPLWSTAEFALGYIEELPSARNGLDHAIEAFALTSIEFLRLQARFRMVGHYARQSAEGLVDELYGDADEMADYYLDGLVMTYALWPNHTRLLRFLVDEFASRLPPDADLLEIGPGHGLLGYTAIKHAAVKRYTALDISRPALDYLEAAFLTLEVQSEVCVLEGDATQSDDARIPTKVDGLICCEVLEHVDDPGAILSAVHRRLSASGVALLSTVANLEAIDHVYLFDDVEDIRSTITDADLDIVAELALPLPGDNSTENIPLNYAAIVRRRHFPTGPSDLG